MTPDILPIAGPDRSAFELYLDPWGKLVFETPAGERYVGVVVARAFPLSHREQWVAICTAGGEELVTIEDVATLPAAVRSTLLAELDRREFLPVIERIERIHGHVEPCEWEVATDRGPTRFLLKTEEDVRRVGDNRALVIDAHGIRYLIEDVKALDSPSRRMLERYLY